MWGRGKVLKWGEMGDGGATMRRARQAAGFRQHQRVWVRRWQAQWGAEMAGAFG